MRVGTVAGSYGEAPSQSLKRPYRMGGCSDGLLGQSVLAMKSVSVRKGILRILARMGLTPSESRPSSVAIRSSRFAPMTSPVRPYSSVPQHHGISCVPKSE